MDTTAATSPSLPWKRPSSRTRGSASAPPRAAGKLLSLHDPQGLGAIIDNHFASGSSKSSSSVKADGTIPLTQRSLKCRKIGLNSPGISAVSTDSASAVRDKGRNVSLAESYPGKATRNKRSIRTGTSFPFMGPGRCRRDLQQRRQHLCERHPSDTGVHSCRRPQAHGSRNRRSERAHYCTSAGCRSGNSIRQPSGRRRRSGSDDYRS